jgi:hypothetical protein
MIAFTEAKTGAVDLGLYRNRSVMGGGWTRMGVSPPKSREADLSRKGCRQVVLNAISLWVSSFRVDRPKVPLQGFSREPILILNE